MKRAISIMLAVLLLISTLSVAASVSASAEDAVESVFLTEFTEENFLRYGTYKQDKKDEDGNTIKDENNANVQEDVVVPAKSITYNEDSSIRVEAEGLNLGVKSIFKLDEHARERFAQCVENGEQVYQANLEKARQEAADAGTEFDPESVAKVAPFATTKIFVENCTTERGVHIDNQTIFTLIMKDGTMHALTTSYMDYKQTSTVKIPFSYKEKIDGTDETRTVIMDSIDDVEAIQVEIYHWNESYRTVVIASPVVSGEPSIPAQPEIVPAEGDGEGYTIINFDKAYRKDYSNEPDKVTYCSTADGDFRASGSGYVKFELTRAGEPGQQKQAFFRFDNDVAAYGMAVANREGGSGMAEITVTLESCVDQHGNNVKAEIDLMMNTYLDGYQSIVKDWQEPGTERTYMFDVSRFGNYSISGVRLAVQNYWYYDKDGNIVEYPESNTAKGGTGVEGIRIRAAAKFSPITVSSGEQSEEQEKTIATVATTEAGSGEVEGAGYEFFLYEKETQAVKWGNAPVEVKYNEDGTVSLLSPKGVARPGCDGKQHQMGWLTRTTENNETVIAEEKSAEVLARMQQALDYANAPGAPGLLAVDVTVNSAWNPGNEEDCSVECLLRIGATDEDGEDMSLKIMQYVGKGDTKTIYMDVSQFEDAAVINSWHIAAQNYANTNNETGAASGVTDVDVVFSTPYVAGASLATTERVTVAADDSVAAALAELYNELPKSYAAYENNEQLYSKLERFISMYVEAGIATQELLESEYGITLDDYAVLMEIWNELPAFGPDDVETGGAAIPVCSVMLGIAAVAVIRKSRKKS